MPRITQEEYDAILRRQTARRNTNNTRGVSASDQKPTEGNALECAVSGEAKGGNRLTLRFTVYATRPCDFDAWHLKECIDMLVHAGVISGDEWHLVKGQIASEKVFSKSEERTEIEILCRD